MEEMAQQNNVVNVQFPVTSSKKLIKIILLVVLELFIIAISVFVGTQLKNKEVSIQQPIVQQENTPTEAIPSLKPTPTTASKSSPVEWKTYKDETNKFKIDYPSNWVFATNTVNKELDIYGTLEPEDVVIFAENDIDTYQVGRVTISKVGTSNDTDIETWFDKTYPPRDNSFPVTGMEPVKEAVLITPSKIRILRMRNFFGSQKYYFALNKTIYSINVNFSKDGSGSDSPKNKELQIIYEKMINSLSLI